MDDIIGNFASFTLKHVHGSMIGNDIYDILMNPIFLPFGLLYTLLSHGCQHPSPLCELDFCCCQRFSG